MAVLGFDPMSLVKMGLAFSLVALAAYIYFAVALMTIAKKKNTPNGWLAFIPIANVYLMTQIAGLPAWCTLVVLLPIIPLIGALAMGIIMVYFWWKIAEAINKPGWWSILMLIPIVNFVIVGIMAWGK